MSTIYLLLLRRFSYLLRMRPSPTRLRLRGIWAPPDEEYDLEGCLYSLIAIYGPTSEVGASGIGITLAIKSLVNRCDRQQSIAPCLYVPVQRSIACETCDIKVLAVERTRSLATLDANLRPSD